MTVLFSLPILVVLFAVDVHSYDYCKNETGLCKRSRHIACYPEQLSDPEVTRQELIPMTKKLRKIIVDEHNKLRNEAACGHIKDKNNTRYPEASRMQQMKWDYELEYTSRLHAIRCTFDHDKCRDTFRFPDSGQNLAILYASDENKLSVVEIIKDQINAWYNEYKDGTIDNLKGAPPDPGVQVGHFTMVVTDKADKIGCSYTLCYKEAAHKVNHLFTCNYSYANFAKTASYSFGDPTSECADFKKKKSSEYKCLCD